MSDQELRDKRSKRLQSKVNKIKKRYDVAKYEVGLDESHPGIRQPHRLHKHNGLNCGNSNCVLCGNPRKMFNEVTIQEKKFSQDKIWSEE